MIIYRMMSLISIWYNGLDYHHTITYAGERLSLGIVTIYASLSPFGDVAFVNVRCGLSLWYYKVKLLSAIFSTKQIYVDEYNVDVDGDKNEDGDDGGDGKDDGSKTFDGCISSEMTSTGTGKIIVLLFSADMLFSVCRYLNYK